MYKLRNVDVHFESVTDTVDFVNCSRDHGVRVTVVKEVGPGGGNPMIDVEAMYRYQLVHWIRTLYCKEDEIKSAHLVNLIVRGD